MKTEQLISKKVKHDFNQKLKQVLFSVESLKEHFDGLLIHESDIVIVLESEDEHAVEYIKISDVNFDNAVSKEVVETPEAVLEIEVTSETLNDNPELVAEGIVVGETITVYAVEPITEVAKTNVETEIVKADYVETIEEIIPAKVTKKKNNKKQ